MQHPEPHQIEEVLQSKIPPSAVAYCIQLWKESPFRFKITQSRKTKTGDFRFNPKEKSHTITLNHDLNPYNFLITYIHEVAHLRNFLQFKNTVAPHGKEWKEQYKKLIAPLLFPQIFPENLLSPLVQHFKNPTASTYTDTRLAIALRAYDREEIRDKGLISLAQLPEGQVFVFHNRKFEKGLLRRTRVLCRDIQNGKKYLIPNLALVKALN